MIYINVKEVSSGVCLWEASFIFDSGGVCLWEASFTFDISWDKYRWIYQTWRRLITYISSLLQGSFAKETYNFKEPTNQSHPISSYVCLKYEGGFTETHTTWSSFTFMYMSPLDPPSHFWETSFTFETPLEASLTFIYMSNVKEISQWQTPFEPTFTFMYISPLDPPSHTIPPSHLT